MVVGFSLCKDWMPTASMAGRISPREGTWRTPQAAMVRSDSGLVPQTFNLESVGSNPTRTARYKGYQTGVLACSAGPLWAESALVKSPPSLIPQGTNNALVVYRYDFTLPT